MYEVVRENCIRHALIRSGETVLCAISGGADSVVMLHILKKLSSELSFNLKAAHVNHMLRGDAADADERFVRELCASLSVPLVVLVTDVSAYAKEHGQTFEQAGRILRYDFFEKQHCDKIATAHHMDDQAESVLLHIVRGSGLRGICGISPMYGNIIRPLLCVRRSQIEEYAHENGLSYCTDATNLVAEGTRNKLRLDVVPYITNEINPRFVESICAMSELARRDDDYLSDIAKAALTASKIDDGYDRSMLKKLDLPILTRAIRLALADIGVHADVEQKHIQMVCELLSFSTGKEICIPHARVITSYNKVVFVSAETFEPACQYEMPLLIGTMHLPDGTSWNFTIISGNAYEKNDGSYYVDADKLQGKSIVIRTRHNGDYIYPLGSGGKKKLKDYYIDKKIERERRNNPLLCESESSDILCVLGMCISERIKVDSNTKSMLRIERLK